MDTLEELTVKVEETERAESGQLCAAEQLSVCVRHGQAS